MQHNKNHSISIIAITKKFNKDVLNFIKNVDKLYNKDIELEVIFVTYYNQVNIDKLVKEYAHLNIRFINDIHQTGIYSALNLGVKEVKNDYIWMFGAEDKILKIPEIKYSDTFQNAYYFDVYEYDRQNNRKKRSDTNSGKYPHPQGLLISSKLLNENNNFKLKYKYASDLEFILRNKLNKLPQINLIIAEHSPGGVSNNKSFKQLRIKERLFLYLENRLFHLMIIDTIFYFKKINKS